MSQSRRAALSSYYPDDADRERERRYITWLATPGDDLAIFLGGPPSVEQLRKAEARRRQASRRGRQ